MGAMTGHRMRETQSESQSTARKGAVQYLQEALEVDAAAEKDFHVKQALQLLDVNKKVNDN